MLKVLYKSYESLYIYGKMVIESLVESIGTNGFVSLANVYHVELLILDF